MKNSPKLSTKLVSRMMNKIAGASSGSFAPAKLKIFLQKEKSVGGISFSRLIGKKEIDANAVKDLYQRAQKHGIIEKAAASAESQIKQLQKIQKEEGIKQARKEAQIWARQRLAAFGGQEELSGGQVVRQEAIREQERVHKSGEQFRKERQMSSGLQKEQERKYEINLRVKGKARGAASSQNKTRQFLNKVMQEQKESSQSAKYPSKSGRTTVELKGTAGIDQLTHNKESISKENFNSTFHVQGLDKSVIERGESSSDSRPLASPAKDLSDLDIG